MDITTVLSMFQKVDEEIENLHKLSSDDFSALNDLFKQNYALSKTFIEYQNNMLDTFKAELPTLSQELIGLDNSFNNLKSCIHRRLKSALTGAGKSKKIIESLTIPIKNYKQNILTINFIISQLQLLRSKDTPELNKFYVSIEQIFKNLTATYKEFENTIEVIDKELIEAISLIDNNQNQEKAIVAHYQKLSTWLHNEIRDKSGEVEEFSFKVNYENFLREFSNEIIINLQYHDIIRQKMEHVQQAYKAISNEISNENHDEKVYLAYLMNLADIQAGQLTHVNKKYQDAIKSISNNVTKLSDHITKFQDEFNEMLEHDKNNNFVSEIIDRIENSLVQSPEMLNDLATSNAGLYNISQLAETSLDQFTALKHHNTALIECIKKLINEKNGKAILNDNLYLQLINISNETTLLAKEISHALRNNESIVGNHFTSTHLCQFEAAMNDLTNSFKAFSGKVSPIKENVEEFHPKCIQIANEILSNQKSRFKSLGYYDYFEKTISRIIQELAELNKNIETSDIDLTTEAIENGLAKVKEMYTMKSEVIIHEQTTLHKANLVADLDDEENNVELF